MSRRSSLSVLAVLAASGALIAGCSSSSTSSSPVTATTAAAASSGGAASSGALSAADCKVISSISQGVISTLMPLQSEPQSKAATALQAYIGKLGADEAQLASSGGKAVVSSFIAAVQKSMAEGTKEGTTTLTNAIAALASACA
jgi:hypothetical protein